MVKSAGRKCQSGKYSLPSSFSCSSLPLLGSSLCYCTPVTPYQSAAANTATGFKGELRPGLLVPGNPSCAASCRQPSACSSHTRFARESHFGRVAASAPVLKELPRALPHSSQPTTSATNQPTPLPSTPPPLHHHAQLSMQRVPEPVQDERRCRGHVSALLALQQQLLIEDLFSRRCLRPSPFQQRRWVGRQCLRRCLRRPRRADLSLCRVQQDAVSASRRRLLQPLW